MYKPCEIIFTMYIATVLKIIVKSNNLPFVYKIISKTPKHVGIQNKSLFLFHLSLYFYCRKIHAQVTTNSTFEQKKKAKKKSVKNIYNTFQKKVKKCEKNWSAEKTYVHIFSIHKKDHLSWCNNKRIFFFLISCTQQEVKVDERS